MSAQTIFRLLTFCLFLGSIPLALFLWVMGALGAHYHPGDFANLVTFALAAFAALAGIFFLVSAWKGTLRIF